MGDPQQHLHGPPRGYGPLVEDYWFKIKNTAADISESFFSLVPKIQKKKLGTENILHSVILVSVSHFKVDALL